MEVWQKSPRCTCPAQTTRRLASSWRCPMSKNFPWCLPSQRLTCKYVCPHACPKMAQTSTARRYRQKGQARWRWARCTWTLSPMGDARERMGKACYSLVGFRSITWGSSAPGISSLPCRSPVSANAAAPGPARLTASCEKLLHLGSKWSRRRQAAWSKSWQTWRASQTI